MVDETEGRAAVRRETRGAQPMVVGCVYGAEEIGGSKGHRRTETSSRLYGESFVIVFTFLIVQCFFVFLIIFFSQPMLSMQHALHPS